MVKMLVRYGPLALRQIKKLKPFNKPKVKPIPQQFIYDPKSKSIFSNRKPRIGLEGSIMRQDKAAKVGRIIEERSLREGLKRIRAKSLSIFGTKGHYEKVPGTNFKRISAKGKRAKAAFTKAGEKVRLISKRKGLIAYDKASTKLGVGKRRYGVAKPKAVFKSDAQRKMEGMPPIEYTADMKSFHSVSPAEMGRRHRASLSKIYSKPKSWRKRSSLISHYRGAAKSELKQAKIDRNIFRETTVQLQTGTTRKGKPIWKTIRSPEKVYDVHTKRWKRTKLF